MFAPRAPGGIVKQTEFHTVYGVPVLLKGGLFIGKPGPGLLVSCSPLGMK